MQLSNIAARIYTAFANAGAKNTIPVASQIGITPGAASYTDGFPPLTLTPVASGGIPPYGADFNGILNAITTIQKWQSGGGLFQYDATWSSTNGGYPQGAWLLKATGTGFWVNLVDNNTTNPDSSGANWVDAGIQLTAGQIAVAAGTADALTATFGSSPITLTNGLSFIVRANLANATTTPTFAPNGLTAAAIVKGAGSALAAGDIAGAGHWLELQYDVSLAKWVLQNPATGVSASGPAYKQIQSLPDPTLSANAMTLPASTHTLDFRSATLTTGVPATVSGTAAALTIPAGATLGAVSAVQSTVVEVIMNNGGTLEKAVINLAGGVDLSETGVISTTAISASATANNVFYSNTARTNLPYRVVREIVSTQATAGQWATSPSLVQGQGGQALAAMQSLGMGQTWQAVTRTSGTTYYNTTGKPIVFSSYSISATAIDYTITVSGVQIARSAYNSATTGIQFVSAIIPPGAPYVLTVVAGGAPTTVELR